MPRGNDPDAEREFKDRNEGVSGNAEDIIKANRARFPKDLREASLASLDVAATEALDLDKVQKEVDDAVDGDVTVVAAAVRGRWVVAVHEDEDGHVDKVALPRDEAGPTKRQVKKAAKKPPRPDQVGKQKTAEAEGEQPDASDED